ncbi:MAG: NADH-quinone oxidoreductase subunit C [Trueperaceae bacterium]|nr:NADH-quinone oxidoreductase subunit C [Trueperaceae bacterium]
MDPFVSGQRLADRMADALAELGGERSERFDQTYVTLAGERIQEAVRRCRDAGFEQLSDVMAIDWLEYPGHQGPRFTVVYNLYSLSDASRLMLRVNVDLDESVPSITPQWPAAGFFEREVYDLFGIEFRGHPDLRKLVTPDDLEGHPLRKDFPLGETPTLFGDGRFLDPATFRAGLMGRDPGRTGWTGGARKGVRSEQGRVDDDGSEA